MKDSPEKKIESLVKALTIEATARKEEVLINSFNQLRKNKFVPHQNNREKVESLLGDAKKLLKKIRGSKKTTAKTKKPEPSTEQNKVELSVKNANVTPDQQRQIDLATEQLKQSVRRVDNQILQKYVQAVQDGDYAAAERILEEAEESQQTNTLAFALLTIFIILLPIYAAKRIRELLSIFGLATLFARTNENQQSIREQAEKAARSHIKTIATDIKEILDNAIDEQLTHPDIEASMKERYEVLAQKDKSEYIKAVNRDKEMYAYARDLILKGTTKINVIRKLQQEFDGLATRRANLIAENEANRVFTLSQFEADSQFLAQNNLTNKAYKRLVSSTGNPESICRAIIEKTEKKPIPFNQDFLEFGKEFKLKLDNGKTIKFKPSYERLKSGHIHAGCKCRYELLIKRDDGTFFNAHTGKTVNDVDFDEDKHKRDKDGKFAKKDETGVDLGNRVDIGKLNTKEKFDEFIETSTLDYGKDEENASRVYQSFVGYAINDALREDENNAGVRGNNVSIPKFTKVFDKAFDIELSNEATVYRGVGNPPSDFIVGKNYLDKGYTSTSTVQSTAKGKFQPPGGALLHITLPKGTNVAIPDLISKKGTLDEQEVLLPRGSSYSVYKIDGNTVYAVLT